jgi:hypothetical protein
MVIRLARHETRIGVIINAYEALVGKLRGRGYLEDLGVDGRIILESILNIQDGKV